MAVVGGRVAMVPAALGFSPRFRRPGARRALAGGGRHPRGQDPLAQPAHGTGATPAAALAARACRGASPGPMTYDVDAHSGRRDRPGDHRADGAGARGHRPPLQLGRGARRHGGGRGHRHPAARRHRREHPQERGSRSRGRSRRRSAPGSARSTSGSGRNSSCSPTCGRRVPSCRAAGSRTWTSCWCARTSRGCTSGSSTSSRSATIRGRWPSRWRSSPARAASGSCATPSSTRSAAAGRRSPSSTRPTSSRW